MKNLSKIIFISIFLIITTQSFAQRMDDSSFSPRCKSIWFNLLEIQIDGHTLLIPAELIHENFINDEYIIKTNDNSIRIDKPYRALNNGLILSIINDNGVEVFVGYSAGPSPHMSSFYLYSSSNDYDFVNFQMEGRIINICIPSTKNIYTENYGEFNMWYSTKLVFDIDHYKEVEQEFYYLGQPSTTNSTIELYDKNKTYKIATLAKDSKIIVIGWFKHKALIKSVFGLTGWVDIEAIDIYFTPDGFGHVTTNIDAFNYESY